MSDDMFKTKSFRRSCTLLVLRFALICLLSGCASTPEPTSSLLRPPDVRLGPVQAIFDVETGKDIVKIIPDPNDQVHVLIASSKLKQVMDVVVRGDEVSKPTIIQTNVSPSRIDGAFDHEGRLHALIDLEHMILEQGVWRTSAHTPWTDAGLKALRAWFVRGGPELTWAFILAGEDVDAPMRMEIHGVIGAWAGVIWPWFTRGFKTVLTTEGTQDFGYWIVLHQQEHINSEPIGLAGDAQGNIHVLYFTSVHGMMLKVTYYYARINASDLKPVNTDSPEITMRRVAEKRLRDVTGFPIQGYMPQSFALDPSPNLIPATFPSSPPSEAVLQNFAVNPETGVALVGMRLLIKGDRYTDSFETPSLLLKRNDSRVAPAGKDSFHVVSTDEYKESGLPLTYRMFSRLEWSAPLELGFVKIASFWASGYDALSLASVGNGRAFVTWPTEHGIVGRWITWDAARTSHTDQDKTFATWRPIEHGIEHVIEHEKEEVMSVHIRPYVTPRDANLQRQTQIQLTDIRKERSFQRTAAFGVSMGQIILNPTVTELVATMIETKSDEILGHQGGSQPETINCELRTFEIATPATLMYWDVNTKIELLLRLRGQERTVSAMATERTYIWPSEEMITRVLNEALKQAGEKSGRALQELLAMPRGKE